jgi:hypothetical protein
MNSCWIAYAESAALVAIAVSISACLYPGRLAMSEPNADCSFLADA